VLGPDEVAFLMPQNLPAYVGLGPGQELIPYFLALLGFMGAALLAILQWPIVMVMRLFGKGKPAAQEELTTQPVTQEPTTQPLTANVPETSGESSHAKP
jgi:hypothetical protein